VVAVVGGVVAVKVQDTHRHHEPHKELPIEVAPYVLVEDNSGEQHSEVERRDVVVEEADSGDLDVRQQVEEVPEQQPQPSKAVVALSLSVSFIGVYQREKICRIENQHAGGHPIGDDVASEEYLLLPPIRQVLDPIGHPFAHPWPFVPDGPIGVLTRNSGIGLIHLPVEFPHELEYRHRGLAGLEAILLVQ